MIKKYEYKDLVWIDLESPTNNEVRSLLGDYSISPGVAEELLVPSLKPKVDLYENCIYLILHFPTITNDGGQKNQEIDFVIGHNFLITSRYETIDPLHLFSRVFEVNSLLDKSKMGEHAGFIFYYMIKNLYRYLNDQLDTVKNSLAVVEDKIFKGEERQMVIELSKINRNLLDFKVATTMHGSVLDSLKSASQKFFGNDFDYFIQSILNEYSKVHADIQNSKDFVAELRSTNDSLLTTKQNEIMKFLTIMAFVTFPLTLVASLLGMNTDYLPIVGLPGDFWIVVAIMMALTTSFFLFFKRKGWL